MAGGRTLLHHDLWSQSMGFPRTLLRKLRYSVFFLAGTFGAPTWLSLLLQSVKQSPLVNHLAHIQHLSFHLGLSLVFLPTRSQCQSSPSFIFEFCYHVIIFDVLSSCIVVVSALLFLPLLLCFLLSCWGDVSFFFQGRIFCVDNENGRKVDGEAVV